MEVQGETAGYNDQLIVFLQNQRFIMIKIWTLRRFLI